MERSRGADLRFNLALELHEALFGCTREITIQHLEVCAACNGQGVQKSWRTWFRRAKPQTCESCHGLGRLAKVKPIIVTIPAGVDYGTRLRIASEGDAGEGGGPPGDLYVFLFVDEALEWQRDGANIWSELLLEPEQAIAGSERIVQTVHGPASLVIPPGTLHNQVLTLKAYGVPLLGKPKQRGDHYVTIKLSGVEDDWLQINAEVDAYAEQGTQKLAAGDCLGAITDLTQAIAAYPRKGYLYLYRGDAYQNLGGYENVLRAVQDYTQSLRFDPDAVAVYCRRAYARQTLEDDRGAIADYTKVLDLDLRYAPAYYQRGRAYYQIKAYGKAIEDFSQAIRVSFEWGDIQPADAYICRGLAYFAQQDYRSAIEDFTQALSLKADYIEAYYYRAESYVCLDQKIAAVADYQIAANFYQRQFDLNAYQSVLDKLKKLEQTPEPD